MANPEIGSADRFVDEQLASLDPAAAMPDVPGRLAQAHVRQSRARVRRLRWAVTGVTAAIVFAAVPATRAFGARCVEACVNATTRVSQLWSADEPEASTPRVVGATIGDIAPDLIGTDSQGHAVHLSALRGRVVVLNFWATWCGPCRAEIPLLNEMQTRLGPRGLTIAGVALDQGGWNAIQNFVAGTPIEYGVALGSDAISDAYGGVDGLPMTFIIDRNGLIVAKHRGLPAELLEQELARMMEK